MQLRSSTDLLITTAAGDRYPVEPATRSRSLDPYPSRIRSLTLPARFVCPQAGMARASFFIALPGGNLPPRSRLAAFGDIAALTPSNVLLKSVQFSIAIDTIDICSPSARTPLHGPRRRGPASRLPCATRRRGPFPLLRTGPPFLLRLAGAGSARHRLPHPAVLGVHTTADAAADASGNVLRTHAVSAFSGDLQSIAAAPPLFPRIVSRSRPSTSCGIVPTPVFNSTTVAGDATLSSLLRGPPSSARHLSRLWSLMLPPRFVCRQPSATLTARRLRRHRPTHAARLATLVVGTPLRIRVTGAGSARHRLPHPAVLGVRTTADAAAGASGSVLRTPAVSAFSTDLHSVAVAAPIRRLCRRRFPLAHTPSSVVPDRVPRLWFSHPTHR